MLMPFGKHKGKEIESIPKGYLRWLNNNCDLQGELKTAVEVRLGVSMPMEEDVVQQIERMFCE